MPSSPSPLARPIAPCAYRGRIAHALSAEETVFLPDGGLLVNADGVIEACDDWSRLEADFKDLSAYERVSLPEGAVLLPGFVDMHVHLPQMEVTGCQAENLLAWLDTHIFAAESRFADAAHARTISRWFFQQLLANGTTTAAVFLTSHQEASQIAFETAFECGNRVVMGQNLMDCHAPEALIHPAEQMLAETEALCQQWHGEDSGRIRYAWMPRFAITSTEPLLAGIGELRKRYPDVYLHTHLSEQPSEIQAVLHQFPWALDYTGVYEKFGLLGPRTILAHGIHLSDEELERIQAAQSALAHCPGSNFFLKSGPFRWFEVLRRGMLFGLGSDVGAGPELSLLKVMKNAQFMQADRLVSLSSLLYSATLGGAEALFQADRIGNFQPGKEADFVILAPDAKPGFFPPKASASVPTAAASVEASSASKLDAASFEALLSRLIYLGDDRLVQATYIRGRRVYAS